MKLTVLQEDLKKAVQQTSHFISNKAQLPILSNILLRATKTRLILSATNLETSITTSIAAKVESEGEVAVNGKTFNDLISNLSSGSIEIEVFQEQLKIVSNKFKSNLLGTNTADFPVLPQEIAKDSIKFSSKDFVKALSRLLFSVSTDETRPILTGVLFIFNENELKLVSTDGFRLTETKLKLNEKQKEFKIIIPKAILNEVSKIESETIEMSWDSKNNQVIFGFNDTILSSRVIEGEFPDYEKIIPQSSICELVIDKEEFEKAIKIASVFARESANSVKMQIVGQNLKVSAESSASGNQETELEVKNESGMENEINIMFNFRFLEEYLKIVEADEFRMLISDNNKASKFIDPKSPNLLHIIMPIKTT